MDKPCANSPIGRIFYSCIPTLLTWVWDALLFSDHYLYRQCDSLINIIIHTRPNHAGMTRCMVCITAWQGKGLSFATIPFLRVKFWTIVVLTPQSNPLLGEHFHKHFHVLILINTSEKIYLFYDSFGNGDGCIILRDIQLHVFWPVEIWYVLNVIEGYTLTPVWDVSCVHYGLVCFSYVFSMCKLIRGAVLMLLKN